MKEKGGKKKVLAVWPETRQSGDYVGRESCSMGRQCKSPVPTNLSTPHSLSAHSPMSPVWFSPATERDRLGIIQTNSAASGTRGVASFYQWMVIKHFQSEQLLLDVAFGIKKRWLEQTQAACSILENVHTITCARGHMVLYLYNLYYELSMGPSLTGKVTAGKLGDSHLYFAFCVNTSHPVSLCWSQQPSQRSSASFEGCAEVWIYRCLPLVSRPYTGRRNRRIWFTFIYAVTTALKVQISISRQWLET